MSEKTQGYRDTLNLPKTRFAMKANLVQNEPQMRKRWAKEDLYGQIRAARKGAIHWKTAARRKSRLAQRVLKLTASKN